MGKLQRLASLSIIGGMQSMLTDLLDAHAGLLPIELTLLCFCHRATIRLCTLPPTHLLHPLVHAARQSHNKKHQDSIKTALRIFELDPCKFETVTPDVTPPTYFSHIKTTLSKTHEDSILTKANDTPDLKIYMVLKLDYVICHMVSRLTNLVMSWSQGWPGMQGMALYVSGTICVFGLAVT